MGGIQSLIQHTVNSSVLAAWLGLSLVTLVWQLVGGWRACDNHVREGGGMITAWIGYSAVLLTLTLAIVQMIDGVTEKTQLQPARPTGTTTLELHDENTVLLVDKPLDWDLYSSFKTTLQNHSSVTTVTLNNSGGYVFTARAMALLIEQYNLDTHVDETCYSACTIVFLAGNKRTINSGAELGFHQYSLQTNHQLQNINISEELKKDRDYFIERGVSMTFVNSIFRADPNNLWKPELKTLIDAGVVTEPVSTW